MTTLAILAAEIALLKARVDALEGGRGTSSSGGAPSSSGGGATPGDALPDHLLDNAWADAKIDKDPPKFKGRTQVGRRYSIASVEWLESAAGFYEWKAQKGREEVPVRLQASGKNAGKPWHEADTFKAKLLRAWAKRAANRPAAPKTGAPTADIDFPFGANAPSDDVGF